MSTSFDKFDQKQWNRLERKVEDPFQLKVFASLCTLGSDSSSSSSNAHKEATDLELNQLSNQPSYQACGDQVYLDGIRPYLVKLNYVTKALPPEITTLSTNTNTNTSTKVDHPNKKPVKKKGGGGNKKKKAGLTKEEIIRQNTVKRIQDTLTNTLETFKSDRLNPSYAFRSNYAEIRIVGLIYCSYKLLHSDSSLNNQIEQDAYELIIGIQKTLKNLSSQDSKVSTTACNDMSYSCNLLKKQFKFTYERLFTIYPKLVLCTKYDKVFPELTVKPYQSQTDLMTLIKQNSAKGGLYFYIAMIGSGKTTFSLALCKYVESQRLVQRANRAEGTQPLQLLFVCSVEPVRFQVCRIAYTMGIKFGVGVVNKDKNVRVINNYNCKKDEDRILVVCDLDAAIQLLQKNQNYVMFLDEPTVGADVPDNPITRAVVQVLMYAPKQSILSSATLPEPEEIPNIVDHFQTRYPGSAVLKVCSKEAIIGCEIRSFDGSTVASHNNCLSCDQITHVVTQLKNKPFIDRLYTAPVLYMMQNRMRECGVTNGLLDLEEYFSDVSNLNQHCIQQMAIEMLESIALVGDDSLVQKVCSPLGKVVIKELHHNKKQAKPKSEEETPYIGFDIGGSDSDEGEESPEEANLEYDINKIFGEHAHKFLGACLCVVKDPITFVCDQTKDMFGGLSATRLIKKYQDQLLKHKTKVTRLDQIKDEDERSKQVQDLNGDKPSIDFPNWMRVNTGYHVAKYAKQSIPKINRRHLQPIRPLETLPLDANVPDQLMLLLFAGVGVFAPNNPQINQEYTDTVLSMASMGHLSFMVSDDTISYGANYPFCHLIISDDVAQDHSINTIFQLCGRVGRVGESWVGFVHVGEPTINRVMGYIHGQESTGITEEATNLIDSFKRQIKLDLEAQVKEKEKIIKEAKRIEKGKKEQQIQPDIAKLNKVVKPVGITPTPKPRRQAQLMKVGGTNLGGMMGLDKLLPPELPERGPYRGRDNQNTHQSTEEELPEFSISRRTARPISEPSINRPGGRPQGFPDKFTNKGSSNGDNGRWRRRGNK